MTGGAGEETAASELRRCLRDVLSLLALPASWERLSPREILVSLVEALETSVHAEVIVAQLRDSDLGDPVVRVRGMTPERTDAAIAWFTPLSSRSAASIARLVCGPLGELTAVYEPLGYYASFGHLIVASERPGFPTPNDVAIIHASTTIVTTAIQTARAMHEREAAVRARDDFMAVLGHELRNPLAPITMALDIIRHRGVELSHEHQVIERQVEYLRRLVDDLLDITRIERGTIELKRTRVELSEIVNDAVEACASLFVERRQELHVHMPETGLVLSADRFRMHQVVVNLLTNAARYTQDTGTIEVSAEAEDGLLRLSVRDNGIGMAPELLPRIFDSFVQAHRSTGSAYSGLGIGLALVRKLVSLHGGTVSASSEGPGQGSCFVVELPTVLVSQATQVAKNVDLSRQKTLSASRRVLVVDDNVDAGELLGFALEQAGHRVEVSADPLQATKLAAEFSAEIAVLDIGMPGLDGFQVAAQMREHLGARAPQLIALTGYGQPEDTRRILAAGFGAHLVKPVDRSKLLAAIDAACAARNTERQAGVTPDEAGA